MSTQEANPNRFSGTYSQNRKGIRTPEELIMMNQFNHRKIKFDENSAIDTGKTQGKNGKPLIYYPDLLFDEKVILEIYGDGSSSDDPDRDAWLKDNDYTPIYASNKSVKASPSFVADFVETMIALCRLRRSLKG